MSEFQVECWQRTLEILDRFRTQAERAISGVHEQYVVVSTKLKQPKLEVYIYADEAGFFYGRDWLIWESQDFSDEWVLMKAFLSELEEKLRQRSE